VEREALAERETARGDFRSAKASRSTQIQNDNVRSTISNVTRERIERREIVRRLFRRYSDPPKTPTRRYDVHDGKQARAAIRRRLRRRRP
jgi:hypothetical protein